MANTTSSGLGSALLGFGAFVAVVVCGLLAIGGWIENVIKLAAAVTDPITALFVLRLIGVFFAPLGIVLGYV